MRKVALISAGIVLSTSLMSLALPAAARRSVGATSPSSRRARGGCPSEMVAVATDTGTFCIDRYEASTVELLPAGGTAPHSPFAPVTGKQVKAVSVRGVFPQGYISGLEASAACEASGKRLCAPEEWQRACMGRTPTTYPYGAVEVAGRCNGDGTRAHPVAELFNASIHDGENPFGDFSKMNDPRINQLPQTLARSGSHARCKSSFGAYDMVGNLHEWTASTTGEFRGGYYMDTHKNGDGCSYKTTAHVPSYRDYSTGFRCCK